MSEALTTIDRAQSGRFRRIRTLSFGLLLALFVLGFFQRFSPATFGQPISTEFSLTASQLGLFAAVNYWVYTAMQVPAGVVIDRFGTRICVGVGGFLTAAGSIMIATASEYWVTLAGSALIGLGTCGIFVGLMKNNTEWFPARRYGLITGITMFVGNLGSMIAQEPAAVLLTVFSWRTLFLALGVLSIGVSLAAVVFVRDSPAAAGLVMTSTGREPKLPQLERLSLNRVVRNRQLWLAFVAVIGTNGTLYAFAGLWGVPLLTEGFRIDVADAARYTLLALAAYGVGNLVIGDLSDRVGRRKPFIVLCSISAVVGWIGLAFLPWAPGWSATVLYLLVGFAGAQVVPAFSAVKEAVPPAAAATSLAVVNVGAFLAAGLIQPAFGRVLDTLADDGAVVDLAAFRVALLIPTALAGLGLACSCFTTETGPGRGNEKPSVNRTG